MEATELMIGDWVFNKHHKKYIQITPYDFFNHAHLPSGEKYFVSELKVISGRDFEPIPLTPEILELNGFHHEDFGYSLVTTDDKSFLLLGVFSGGTYLWHEAKIYYVHELQHAFRICGLNGLADNFRLEE